MRITKENQVNKWVRAASAALVLSLAGCGGAKIGDESSAGSGSDCGQFNIAINPWVGYEANAAVLA